MDEHQITELVNVIFKKLTLAYGRDFLSKWEGLDMGEVKSDWAHEMVGYASNPLAVRYALQNLPVSKAPNVYEFRAICQRAPEAAPAIMLDRPRANPEVVRKAMAAARAALSKAAQ